MTLGAWLVPRGASSPGDPGAAEQMTTDAGLAILRPGARDAVLRGNGFVASWTPGIAADAWTLPRPPTVREARAGALLVATPEGLSITRGPYGGRPLYYMHRGSMVLVSSTLLGLVGTLPERPAFNADRLGAIGLAKVGLDPRATVYQGVYRVLPCETVTFTANGGRSSFALPRQPETPRGGAEAHATLLREGISAAIARCTAPFSAVGVFTGGGLDSSGLLALVREHARRRGGLRFTGVSFDFGGPGDDRPHLMALLELLGATALRITPGEVGSVRPGFFVQDAAPYSWPSCACEVLAARRATAWGADVLMTGAGGDDVLDGNEGRFAERVRTGDPLGALADAARLQLYGTESAPARIQSLIVQPLLRPHVPRRLLRRRRLAWLRHREVWRWAGPRLRPRLADYFEGAEPEDDWLTGFALSHELMEMSDARGQSEAATRLPWVDPYLDPTLVELAASLPADELFHDHRQRGLFRLAMKGLFPESLRLRSDKASFEPLFGAVFAGAVRGHSVRALASMEATADLGLVLPGPFRSTLDQIAGGEAMPRGWLEVWPMLAVEGFLRSDGRSGVAEGEA